MPLEDLGDEYKLIRDKANAAEWVRKDIAHIMLTRMDQDNLDKVGPWEIRRKYGDEYSDHAEWMIDTWGGKHNMPIQIVNEIELNHKIRVPQKPYLFYNGRNA